MTKWTLLINREIPGCHEGNKQNQELLSVSGNYLLHVDLVKLLLNAQIKYHRNLKFESRLFVF